jgi:hypothetical protein
MNLMPYLRIAFIWFIGVNRDRVGHGKLIGPDRQPIQRNSESLKMK